MSSSDMCTETDSYSTVQHTYIQLLNTPDESNTHVQ